MPPMLGKYWLGERGEGESVGVEGVCAWMVELRRKNYVVRNGNRWW
jgi:hypothetical protein